MVSRKASFSAISFCDLSAFSIKMIQLATIRQIGCMFWNLGWSSMYYFHMSWPRRSIFWIMFLDRLYHSNSTRCSLMTRESLIVLPTHTRSCLFTLHFVHLLSAMTTVIKMYGLFGLSRGFLHIAVGAYYEEFPLIIQCTDLIGWELLRHTRRQKFLSFQLMCRHCEFSNRVGLYGRNTKPCCDLEILLQTFKV